MAAGTNKKRLATAFREGEAPAELGFSNELRLGRSLALPEPHIRIYQRLATD